MNLVIHLLIHVFFAFVAGYITWFFFGELEISLIAGFFGGVLIDLDHLIDYFIAFGSKFKLQYFLRGYQFVKNDKIYVLFHGWEYVILSAIGIIVLDGPPGLKALVWGLTLGAFFHLIADRYINHGMTFKSYSVCYRMWNKFEMKGIVTPEHYRLHEEHKKTLELK